MYKLAYSIQANQINKVIKISEQKIYSNYFSDIQCLYDKLEFIIEKLARVLNQYGYYRDNSIRTINSGEYDITHMIYATFCDYFVIQDNRLYNRALAIYYYLSVQINVFKLDEFVNIKL